MVEGKTDFYVLKYIANALGHQSDLHLLPGTGAGSLKTPIQLYLAWGRPFVVLLDGDTEGTKQAKRYVELFGDMMKTRLLTLADVHSELAGAGLETLFEDDEKLDIQRLAYPDDAQYSKKHLHRAIQEQVACARVAELGAGTAGRASGVLRSLSEALARVREEREE
jgi:hypothetical protein